VTKPEQSKGDIMSREELIQYGTFLLRLSLGTLFLAHGSLKLFVFKPAGTAAYFRSLGLPGVVGYLTILGELGGGTLLIFGVATSLVAIVLVPLIIGTIVMVHGSKGWMFSNEGGGWEFPAFWSAALVVQALLGSGPFSLDHTIGLTWP
jgi:putative oxidoreductase